MIKGMKNSGVEWIGQIPENWQIRKVSSICETIGSGTTPKSDNNDYYDGNINWLQSGDINGGEIYSTSKKITQDAFKTSSALKIYTKDFIVIALYGASIGNVSISKIDACVNQACCVLKSINHDNDFLYYSFKAAQEHLASIAVGGTQPNISQNLIKCLRLPLPSGYQESQIATFLNSQLSIIDSIILQTKSTIEEYKLLKQSIITEAVTKGLDKNVEMKDSGVEWIGQIPKHWKISKFKNEIYIRARLGWKGLKAEEYVPDGVIFLATPNIRKFEIDFDNVNYISQERYEESPEIKLSLGDVLLAKDGSTLGIVNVIRDLKKPATVNGSIAVLTPGSNLDSLFLNYFIQSSYLQNLIQIKKDGMGVPHLFQRDIRQFTLLVPPLDEQVKIADYVEGRIGILNKLIDSKENLLFQLDDYKKSTIYEYVTGKKEVP